MQYEIENHTHVQRQLAAIRRRSEKIQLHRAMVGSVKRPIMWRELCVRINNTVTTDKAMVHANVVTMKREADGNSFTLDRPSYPKARVIAVFKENLLIELHCCWKKTDNAPAIEWEDLIEMPVDELDRVSFQQRGDLVSQDDVALLILAPVRDPTFKPPL